MTFEYEVTSTREQRIEAAVRRWEQQKAAEAFRNAVKGSTTPAQTASQTLVVKPKA